MFCIICCHYFLYGMRYGPQLPNFLFGKDNSLDYINFCTSELYKLTTQQELSVFDKQKGFNSINVVIFKPA